MVLRTTRNQLLAQNRGDGPAVANSKYLLGGALELQPDDCYTSVKRVNACIAPS
jgi:hypothetical protein